MDKNQDPENLHLMKDKRKEYVSYEQIFKGSLNAILCNKSKLFKRPRGHHKELSKFENILISTEDKSAIISMVFRLYQNEKFLSKTIDLSLVMKYIHEGYGHFLNLFSILIHNWNDINDDSEYFLIMKFDTYQKATNNKESLFEKLFSIIDDKEKSMYHHICLKIIYYYFDEVNKSPIENILENSHIQDLIIKATKLRNEEYKARILKILVIYLDNTKDEIYNKIKERVLKSVNYNFSYTSVAKISYESIVRHLDDLFFQLVFLLKENQILHFKTDFEKFKSKYQQLLGDYWSNAIRLNSQLLYRMAEEQSLRDTSEFLLQSTGDFELKQPITAKFKKLEDFYVVFNEPLDKENEKILTSLENFIQNEFISIYDDFEICFNTYGFERKFKNTPIIRKFLFGRRDLTSKSLFETILSINNANVYQKADHDYVLNYIWNEFRLFEIPELLTIKNPMQKTLLDYVLETKNNRHLMSFLMTVPKDYTNSTQRPKHFMMLKNSLYHDHKKDENDKSLIEFQLNAINYNDGSDPYNLDSLMYLFEEIGIYTAEQTKKNQYIRNIIDKVMKEKSEKFDGQHELRLPRKHFLIGILMTYWKCEIESEKIIKADSDTEDEIIDSEDYQESPTKSKIASFTDKGFLFFKLLYLIINKKDTEFHNIFAEELKRIEKSFVEVYQLESTYDNKHQHEDEENIFHYYEKYSANFMYVLLYAAIKTNQKEIVDHIFKYNNFLITEPTFPSNIEPDEIHRHTMIKFLENKYEIGRDSLPRNWITHEVLEKFLNSRIESHGGFYKVDCRFMLPYYNYDLNLKSPKDVDDDLLMNEDYDTMEHILNDHELKPLVTHPVLEMIIKIKTKKYSRILTWNLLTFILLYIIPTIVLVYLFHSNNDTQINATNRTESNRNNEGFIFFNVFIIEKLFYNLLEKTPFELNYILIYILITMRLPYIMAREYFQYRVLYRDSYFKESSNIIEFGLISFPIVLLITTIIHQFLQIKLFFMMITFFEVCNVIAMIAATAFLFPTLRFSISWMCFRRIFTSYVNILFVFFSIFLGFATLFYIIHDYYHDNGNDFMENVIVYAGEPIVRTDKVSGIIQGAMITFIIVLVINKANFVLSIVVNDIKTLIHQSKELSLIYNAKKYVKFAKNIRIFYACTDYKEKKSFKEKAMLGLVRKFLRKYPFIHRLQNLFIDKDTKTVYADIERFIFETNDSKSCSKFLKLSSIFDYISGPFKCDLETMEKIEKIIHSVIKRMHQKAQIIDEKITQMKNFNLDKPLKYKNNGKLAQIKELKGEISESSSKYSIDSGYISNKTS
ncbi:uncharacterized protein [Chironomus tepperi]|uniref:uncharacterized protein n=1 Tax=Chironomus tepperi TaxID=113505 RepID=UPI00391FBD94